MFGNLGIGSTKNQFSPQKIKFENDEKINKIFSSNNCDGCFFYSGLKIIFFILNFNNNLFYFLFFIFKKKKIYLVVDIIIIIKKEFLKMTKIY